MPKSKLSVAHIAKLAAIPVTKKEESAFEKAFAETLRVVEELKTLDLTGVEPTHQVTALENIWREDVVDTHRMFSQTQALANAAQTHEGYFVVPRVLSDTKGTA